MISDLEKYEASYSEENGGCYFIEKENSDYIGVPRLKVSGRVLYCDFEILKENFSEDEISELIFIVLLHNFCRDEYQRKVDFVEFKDVKTENKWRLSYVF